MLERAAHLTEGWANSPWDAASGQPRVPEDVRGGARHVAALEWWGAASWSSPVRLGARRPTHHHTKGVIGRMLVGRARAA